MRELNRDAGAERGMRELNRDAGAEWGMRELGRGCRCWTVDTGAAPLLWRGTTVLGHGLPCARPQDGRRSGGCTSVLAGTVLPLVTGGGMCRVCVRTGEGCPNATVFRRVTSLWSSGVVPKALWGRRGSDLALASHSGYRSHFCRE